MISDVLSDACAAIEDYMRDMPHVYASYNGYLVELCADMERLRGMLDAPLTRREREDYTPPTLLEELKTSGLHAALLNGQLLGMAQKWQEEKLKGIQEIERACGLAQQINMLLLKLMEQNRREEET